MNRTGARRVPITFLLLARMLMEVTQTRRLKATSRREEVKGKKARKECVLFYRTSSLTKKIPSQIVSANSPLLGVSSDSS